MKIIIFIILGIIVIGYTLYSVKMIFVYLQRNDETPDEVPGRQEQEHKK